MDVREFKAAVNLVRSIGHELRENSDLAETLDTSGRDVKTIADAYSDQKFISELSKISRYPILSEESGQSNAQELGSRYWVVDPLDGTMNYTRRFPMSCISLGFIQDSAPVTGIVYDFIHGDMYLAWEGVATLNDSVISVSTTQSFDQGILATGFPLKRDYNEKALAQFIQQIRAFKKIRMVGAAAISLAYVARGGFDAYFEEDIMIWDVAAGLALVKAAGGQILVNPGSRKNSVICVATNHELDINRIVKSSGKSLQ